MIMTSSRHVLAWALVVLSSMVVAEVGRSNPTPVAVVIMTHRRVEQLEEVLMQVSSTTFTSPLAAAGLSLSLVVSQSVGAAGQAPTGSEVGRLLDRLTPRLQQGFTKLRHLHVSPVAPLTHQQHLSPAWARRVAAKRNSAVNL